MVRTGGLRASLGLATILALGAFACGEEAAAPAVTRPVEEAPVAAGETPVSTPAPESAPAAASAAPPTPTSQATQADVTPTELPSLAVSGRTGDEKLAPELVGTGGWINSEPFTLESQRGKVVLVDIWTYTCINCIRTFPYLREWHEKYAERGLVIVGVHTPEFEFEKDFDNVADAAVEFGLEYPIVQDNDYGTWGAFNNRFWPAKYLIDKDGYIRYTHFGEGDYAETEQKIQELLIEANISVGDIALNLEQEPELDPKARPSDPREGQTRELYAGLERNLGALRSGSNAPYILYEEFYEKPFSDVVYEDPGDYLNHFIYLRGVWHSDIDSLTHARETENYEDYIAVKFNARTVNVVLGPGDGAPYEVRVTIDEMPLTRTQAGTDIRFDEDDNSYILVDASRMYRLVELPEFASHELKLSANSADFSVFAYTFGSYKSQPESQ